MSSAGGRRSGAYYWAGPGTIRMIDLKYFSPRIDREAFLHAYDVPVLRQMQSTLGTTDAWVTYSWGFSDRTERPDRLFLRKKLQNFHRLGIRTHAYVQGTNLVRDEHTEHDYYCRDHRDRTIPYHRGRLLCCVNNPHFRSLLLSRVEAACGEDVDGVFIDNFHFGQFPIPVGKYLTFFGCRCAYCRRLFQRETGFDIPLQHDVTDAKTQAYIAFRRASLESLAREIQQCAHAHGKQFGVNGLDLDLPTQIYYGYDPLVLQSLQDYLLVENFNHPLTRRRNAGLLSLIHSSKKPVFVVSYRSPIGRQPQWRQRDIDAIFTESRELGYAPCYKSSEFTTRGRWHPLRMTSLFPPKIIRLPAMQLLKGRNRTTRNIPGSRHVLGWVNRIDGTVLSGIYERRPTRFMLGWLTDAVMVRRVPKSIPRSLFVGGLMLAAMRVRLRRKKRVRK